MHDPKCTKYNSAHFNYFTQSTESTNMVQRCVKNEKTPYRVSDYTPPQNKPNKQKQNKQNKTKQSPDIYYILKDIYFVDIWTSFLLKQEQAGIHMNHFHD